MDGLNRLDSGSIGAPATAWQIAGLGDYDGDAQADILWRDVATGNTVIWQMNGITKEASAGIGNVSGGWHVP